MDNLDRMIAEALAKGDDTPADPGYFRLAASALGGRTGWVTAVMLVVQTLLFLAALWAGWRFYAAIEVLSALKWGLSAAVLTIIAVQLKMALMPVLQANRVLLAIRRLELRLAQHR